MIHLGQIVATPGALESAPIITEAAGEGGKRHSTCILLPEEY